MRRSFVFSLICFVLLSALMSVSPALGAVDTAFKRASCTTAFSLDVPETMNVECGYLSVPSNHENPSGKQLQLGVVIFRAKNALPDPVFMAQGGPGGSTIETYAQILLVKPDFRGDRDFVLMEQRGTLRSKPSLYCNEADALVLKYLNVDVPIDQYTREYEDVMMKCHDRLVNDGVELSDFNSYENARDIEDLRLALGYNKINLYGVSYGTLLAQHYMRLFPDSLRSVVLDGVVPTEKNIFLDTPAFQQRSFRHLFDSCAADTLCNRYYPNLEKVFYELVDQLDAAPIQMTLRDFKSGQEYPAVLDGYGLQGVMFQTLYSSDFARSAPYLIYAVKNGNYDPISTLVSLVTFDHTMSYGMYFSVMCAEDSDFQAQELDLSQLEPRIAEYNRTSAEDVLRFCKRWNVKALDAQADAPVKSDVPTLLLAGSFDPVTPLKNAQVAAQYLSKSYVVEFPHGAHGQLFDSDCSNSIVQAFWDKPGQAPDSSCIAKDTEPLFYGRETLIPVPVLLRVLKADSWLLLDLAIFGLAWLGLFSSLFILPVAWLARLASPAQNRPKPGLALRFGGLLTWLNLTLMMVLVVVVGVIFFQMALSFDNLILFGFYANTRPLFLLPWGSLFLTLGMLVIAVLGWRSAAWSIWRKLYYTFLCLCALTCLGVLVWWQSFQLLFA